MGSHSISNALITIDFDGEGSVSIGANEFFVKPVDGSSTLMLDDTRLDLIRRVMNAQEQADEEATGG